MAAPPPALPALDNTMGVTFVGTIMAAALYGATSLQTWSYYREYPSDPWGLKTLVGVIWVFETLHQIFITHTVYTYLITNFFNPAELGLLVWSLIVEVLFNSLVALLVQTFFIMRIYTLSNKNMFLCVPVFLLAVAQFVAYLYYTGKALGMESFAQLEALKDLTLAINALTAAADVGIAAILCTLLNGSRTGFRRSDSMINKLILFTINTGLLTSIDALCALATHAAYPDTFIYILFFFNLGRLYSNSLLATLNARKSIRNASAQEESISLGPSQSSRGPAAVLASSNKNINIQIDTTHEFNSDMDNQTSTLDMKTGVNAF